MTLVQLEYIVALDTYGSFVLAAENSFVTQPTLSMQVQKLEENLGVQLFDRSRQPVVPTEIGKLVVAQARTVLAEAARIKELISEAQGELSGELKIGVIPTVAPYLLPKVLTDFGDKYPKLKLQIWEYTTEQIIQELKKGQLDCGILSTPIEDESLHEIPLYYETFVAYLSKSSSLLSQKTVASDDLDPNQLWLLNEGHCMRNQILNICAKKSKGDNNKAFDYNTGSIETLKRMVDLNKGMTILPELSLSELSNKHLDRVRYFSAPEP